LVVIGATLGLAEYLCDPFAGNAQRNAMLSLVVLNFGLALFNLPAPSLPGCYVVTHSLNSPSWSLTQEYLANIFYGFFGRKLTRAWLGAIWLVCAAGTLWAARHYHDLSLGWGWPTLLPGLIRTLVSFCAGILVYRLNLRLNLPWAFPVLSLALLCIFAAPYSIMKNWGGMYDALCVLAFFPVMVAAGAGSRDSAGLAGRVCRVLGRLSYPLYILHYPFVSFFLHWTKAAHPTPQTMYGVMGLTVAGVVVFAWLLLRYFDEPLRLRLGSKLNACTGR
jgi:peptidoglycan/LPS O-acetylase OafA/YrhL